MSGTYIRAYLTKKTGMGIHGRVKRRAEGWRIHQRSTFRKPEELPQKKPSSTPTLPQFEPFVNLLTQEDAAGSISHTQPQQH